MLLISPDRVEAIEDAVQEMSYKLGDNYDTWYPTKEDVDRIRPVTTEEDLSFLLWCLHPARKLEADEENVRKYIRAVLAEEIEFDEPDRVMLEV